MNAFSKVRSASGARASSADDPHVSHDSDSVKHLDTGRDARHLRSLSTPLCTETVLSFVVGGLRKPSSIIDLIKASYHETFHSHPFSASSMYALQMTISRLENAVQAVK